MLKTSKFEDDLSNKKKNVNTTQLETSNRLGTSRDKIDIRTVDSRMSFPRLQGAMQLGGADP